MANKRKHLILPVALLLSLAGLVGCNKAAVDTRDPQINAIYEMYKADAESKGAKPKSYDEWLASIKGADGVDGVTPHIGHNGDWYIGDTDTGVKAKGLDGGDGADGHTPYIGPNDNWFIDGVDTGVCAIGRDGKTGVGIADIEIVYYRVGTAQFASYTFTFTNGQKIVKDVLVDHKHADTPYHFLSLDEENHAVLAADMPCEYCEDYNTVVSSRAFEGGVHVGGDPGEYNDFISVTGSASYPWSYNALFDEWSSTNYDVNNSESSMTMTAKVAGVLTFEVESSGETSYDYAYVTTTVAPKAEATPSGWTGKSNQLKPATITVVMEAGSAVTITYRKDSSGARNDDCGYVRYVDFKSTDIPVKTENIKVASFMTNGAGFAMPSAALVGETFEAPAIPTKEGKVFVGWYTSRTLTTKYDFNAPVVEDVVLYAKWADPIYVSTTVLGEYEEFEAAAGEPFYIADFHDDWYKFEGWFTTPDYAPGTEFISGTILNGGVDLYAKTPRITGYFEEDPFVVDVMDMPVTTTAEFSEVHGINYWISVTPEEDQVVTFTLSNKVNDKTGKYTSGTSYFSFVGVTCDGETLPYNTSSSRSAGEDIKEVAHLNSDLLKVTMTANKTYKVKVSSNYYHASSSTYDGYGTMDITVNAVSSMYTYMDAEAIDVEDMVTFEEYEKDLFKWYTFSVDTDGKYLLNVNMEAGNNRGAFYYVGTIDSGKFTQTAYLNAFGTSEGNKLMDLKAGVTYYIAMSPDAAGTSAFRITSEIPGGFDPSTAIAITAGETFTVKYLGDTYVYYTFVASETANYLFKKESSASLYIYTNPNYSSGSVTTTSAKDNSNYKFAKLTAGTTYYVKFYTTSSTQPFDVVVDIPTPGSSVDNPITLTWGESATVTPSVDGTWYSYNPSKTAVHDFLVPDDVTVEIGKVSYSTYSKVSTFVGPTTATVSETSGTDVYMKVSSDTVDTPVDLTTVPHVGPFHGLSFLNKQFNGTNDGSSYYKCFFQEDGVQWESSSTVYFPSNVKTNEKGYLTFNADKPGTGATWFTDGNTVVVLQASTDAVYMLDVRQTNYNTSKIDAHQRATSTFKCRTEGGITPVGLKLVSIALSDGTRTTAAIYNGEVFLNVTLNYTAGTNFWTKDSAFTVTLGTTTLNVTTDSYNLILN